MYNLIKMNHACEFKNIAENEKRKVVLRLLFLLEIQVNQYKELILSFKERSALYKNRILLSGVSLFLCSRDFAKLKFVGCFRILVR